MHTQHNNEYYEALMNSVLVKGIAKKTIDLFFEASQCMEIKQKHVLLKEGEISNKLFLLVDGTVEVKRLIPNSKESYTLFELGKGSILGEISLIDNQPHSSSIITKTRCKLLCITNEFIANFPITSEKYLLLKNISLLFANRLRETTTSTLEEKVELYKTKLLFGNMMSNLLSVLGVYTLFSPLITRIDSKTGGSIVSFCLLLFMAYIALLIIKKSSPSLEPYGFNLNNWKRNTSEAFLYTTILVVLYALLKVSYESITGLPTYFRITQILNYGIYLYLTNLILYTIAIPLQEIIARGALQTIVFNFLDEQYKFRAFRSIMLSNLLFSATHIHKGFLFAITAFIPGVFWGWLYYRQGSLLGPIVSHFILGIFVIFIIGI